jgi:hypothetical protein
MTKDDIEYSAIEEFGEEISFEIFFDSDHRKYIEFRVETEKDAEKLIEIIPWKYHGYDTIVTFSNTDIEELMSKPWGEQHGL